MARPSFDLVNLTTPVGLKPLMAYWRTAKYLEQRRMRIAHSEDRSHFLYKYWGLNGKYDSENLRNTIVRSVLRLAAPATFNDPFEMFVHIIVEGSRDERIRRFKQIIFEQKPSMTEEQQEETINILMNTPDSDFVRRCQRSIANIRKDSGVLCFAGDPRNVLMWSHYAENHQGICLQYERIRDFPTLAHAVRVTYRDDLPVVNWMIDFQKNVDQILLSKHPCWQYEDERRITSPGNANRYIQLRPDALTAVIFGCRIDKEGVEFINTLLSERESAGLPPIKTYVAVQHETRYELVIRNRTKII